MLQWCLLFLMLSPTNYFNNNYHYYNNYYHYNNYYFYIYNNQFNNHNLNHLNLNYNRTMHSSAQEFVCL